MKEKADQVNLPNRHFKVTLYFYGSFTIYLKQSIGYLFYETFHFRTMCPGNDKNRHGQVVILQALVLKRTPTHIYEKFPVSISI